MSETKPLTEVYNVGGMAVDVEFKYHSTATSVSQKTTLICPHFGINIDGIDYNDAVEKFRTAVVGIIKGLKPEDIKRHYPAEKVYQR